MLMTLHACMVPCGPYLPVEVVQFVHEADAEVG